MKSVRMSQYDRDNLLPHLKKGWGYLGSFLKGNTDPLLIRKLLMLELENAKRENVITNLVARLWSINRKATLEIYLKKK